ncbi:MAG: PEP-CTERM sorting domain-containing protein [Phycisphaerales bacterium]
MKSKLKKNITTMLILTTITVSQVFGISYEAIYLTPSGFNQSQALGIGGIQQVGNGRTATGGTQHHEAMLWNGSAESYVDLHPGGFTDSFAYGTNGIQQVGFGRTSTGNEYALLWSGSAESCIDLNPSGFDNSWAYGTSDVQQVGEGDGHALLWSGSAESYVDLHPSGFNYSEARAIDIYGNIIGWGYNLNDKACAILWVPIPEPAAFLLFGLGTAILRRKSYEISQ